MDMRNLLLTIFLLLILFVIAVYSVGLYFLEDNFVTNDAAPLADPHTTEPGGQSVDAVETDGTMAIANGKLTFTAQASPVDGDLGLRYATDMSIYMGRTVFYKLNFSSLTNGIAGIGNASELFGMTGVADITFNGINPRGFGTNATHFIGWTTGNVLNDFNFHTRPTTTDSFYAAIILGGATSTASGATSPTWYVGQNAAPDTNGCFYFIKKNAAGSWLLQGRSYGLEEAATAYPAITSYNGVFSVDRWAASNDTLRNSYCQPIHLQKMDGTAGNQLFDDTPEVGAAYDSVQGNWVFTSDNRIVASGANPGGAGWITKCTTADDDVFMESSVEMRIGDGSAYGMLFRLQTSPIKFITIYPSAGDNTFNIYTFETGSFTQRATIAVSFPATATPSYVAGCVYDSANVTIMKGWYEGAAGTVYNLSYTHSATFNTGTNDNGILVNGTGTNVEINEVRIFALGTDGEYAGLDAYFAGAGGRRRWIVQ